MKLIANKGNFRRARPLLENSPQYIVDAIEHGFDVKVDVHFIEANLYLGEKPHYKITEEFLLAYADKLWIEVHDIYCYKELSNYKKLNIFMIGSQKVVTTTHGFFWKTKGELDNFSVAYDEDKVFTKKELRNCYGICSSSFAKKFYKGVY